tara:strand:+ start:2103 stop:2267 length:165 start_codon:yes stop_codon:yes gene_type:complete
MADPFLMHSWIFRNRARLQRIYCARPGRTDSQTCVGRVVRHGREVVLVPARRAS